MNRIRRIFARALPASASRAPAAGIVLAATIACTASLSAQESQPADTVSRPEISSVTFEGNVVIPDETLAATVGSRESPSGFSQFLHGTFWAAFGSPAEYFDPATLDQDVLLLSELYETKGFYNSTITAAYATDSAEEGVAVRFDVVEGPRSLIDTLIYAGIDSLAPELQAKIYGHAIIHKGDPYEADVVSAEIVRVVNFLQNSGYPAVRFDYEEGGAFRYTSTNNFEIRLVFVTGRLYHFGEIAVNVDPPRDDITPDLAIRHLEFKTGDVYSKDLKVTSERNLNRLDLFEAARVDQETDPESLATPVIPMRILVKPQPRNEFAPEVIASNENGALNLGLGVGYTNRNFFGDGRTFSARLQGRSQSIIQILKGVPLKDSSIIGSTDLELRLIQPYLFTRTMTGSLAGSVGLEKQELYVLSIVKTRLGSSIQLSRTAVGLVEWTLERVSPDFLTESDQPDTLIEDLEAENQPQFNSIIAFTWQRDMTFGALSPVAGYIHTVTVEESGVLPKVFPGITSGLPYTQYYKVSFLSRWYSDLSDSKVSILALKARTGYQNKYGASVSSEVDIPLNRRFFAGGSNSVRGWKSRKLGAMPAEQLEFGGNFILEGGLEVRFQHFANQGRFLGLDLESMWGVYFLDIGNVWLDYGDFKPSDIAVAAGVGFRYETLFGPFRLDFGMRMYDPAEKSGNKSVFGKKFFAETVGRGVFHLGIGHAF